MTKHDYDRVAQAIADVWGDSETQQAIAESIAEALEANNDNFDRAVFLAKCGIKI